MKLLKGLGLSVGWFGLATLLLFLFDKWALVNALDSTVFSLFSVVVIAGIVVCFKLAYRKGK